MSTPPNEISESQSPPQQPTTDSETEMPLINCEKLEVYKSKLSLPAVYLSTGLKALFRGSDGAETWHREVYTSISRRNAMNGPESPEQRRERWPSTSDVVDEYCKKENIRIETVELVHGAKLHLVGERSSEGKVILWYHGGGYVGPLKSGHVIFLMQCVKRLEESGKTAVLCIVEYGLAPEVRYPVQYIQGVEAVRHLLNEAKYEPSDIIIGGDSSGGNLALGVISHILHPHKDIQPLTLGSKVFGGILLLSPWVTFENTAKSFKENAEKDYLYAENAAAWAPSEFCDHADYNSYNVPLSADPSWWTGFPGAKTLLVCGEWELSRDDIKEIGERMGKGGVQGLTVESCPKEVHAACIFDAQFGFKPQIMAKTVFGWLVTVFS
ncbi:alpha/beta-hydrolase [Morchella conica CCBAS932]|uniref:Alpha/beta-hydrolase n=1 Tax=Morchella conica CCBAS932 TaxID=1392247 RepID=A0A3N4KWP1_9PEZI|nr:alpha/beta-hydrolase [Morchella conica CCBAS932]